MIVSSIKDVTYGNGFTFEKGKVYICELYMSVRGPVYRFTNGTYSLSFIGEEFTKIFRIKNSCDKCSKIFYTTVIPERFCPDCEKRLCEF